MTPEGFSEKVPGLRLAWDATALSRYMRDPLSYYWEMVLGYRSPFPNAARLWGTLWGEITAEYKRQRLTKDREAALHNTILFTIARAQETNLNEVSANSKKNDVKQRNTYTLVRSLIWWEDRYKDDWIELATINGEPAIEVQFVLPMGFKASTGEDYVLVGHLDEIVRDKEQGDLLILERKHTVRTVSDYYFYGFDPNVQTYTYDLVGSIILPDTPLRGVIVEACQTAVGFSRFERHDILRYPEQRVHWFETLKYWIRRAEQDALNKTWEYAMNPETTNYESDHRNIQRRSPSMWPIMLDTDLDKQPLWNPLKPKTVNKYEE